METDTPTARPAPAGGSALALAAAEQRGALMRYATRLLEGAAGAAGEVVETALRDVAAQPGEGGERTEEQVARTLFAAVRRGVLARLRSEGVVQRPAPADGEAPGATLEERIERLTPKQREAVWLKFSHGFGYEAISGIAGLSLHNVSFLLHSALTNLREARAADGKVAAADDARVTDYVLGEMNESERGAFEGFQGQDAAAKNAVAEVRSLVRELEATLGGGETKARRVKGSVEAGERKRKGVAIVVGVIGAMVLGGGVWWWHGQKRPTASAATEVGEQFRMKPDEWRFGRARADGAPERGVAKGGGADGIGRIKVVEPFVAISPRLKKGKEVEEQGAARPAEENARVWARGGGGGGGVGALGSGAAVVVAGPAAALAAQAAEMNGETGAARGNSAAATVVAPSDGRSGASTVAAQGGGKAASLPAVLGGAGRGPAEATRGGAAAPRAGAQGVAATATGAKAGEGAAPAKATEAVRGADPDTAAMATLRVAVAAKRWPEPAEVGTQALVNYFPSESAKVTVRDAGVEVAVEVAEAPWASERKLVRVVVRAAPPKTPRAAMANLVLLVDVSRSMDAPNRLPLVQEAVRRLLHDLRPEDRVAIVTYAGEARVALPSTPMARAADVRAVLAGLRAEGMTNGAAGLRRAYELARAGFVVGGVNRVVLCTDGDFNMGVTSESELGALVEAEAKGRIGLGVFGFGRGRAIDPRLETLASKGRGGSGHVNSRREAERRMAAEVNGWNATEVRGVQLGLAGDPVRIAASRLVGHDESLLPPEDAGRKSLEVSELAPGEAITALFEIVPKVGERAGMGTGAAADGEVRWLTLNLGYRAGGASGGEPRSLRVPVGGRGRRWAEASAEFKFTAAVAGLGLALRERPVDGAKLAAVVRWAEEAAAGSGPDPGGYREEFLALAREVRELAK